MSKKNVDFTYNYGLRIDGLKIDHEYGIIIHHLVKNKPPKKIQYTNIIKNEGLDKEKKLKLSLNKTQVYINHLVPNLLAETLAQDLGRIMYPINLSILKNGQINQLVNHVEILNRWKKGKEKITNYYKLDFNPQIIKRMDKAYTNPQRLMGALQNNLFYSLFFLGLYIPYGENLTQHKKIKIPFYPFIPGIAFDVLLTVDQTLNARKKIVIQLKGNVSDTRSSKDIIEKNHTSFHKESIPLKGVLNIKYELDSETKIISSIKGNATLFINDTLEKELKIEAYHLRSKNNNYE